MKQIKIKTQEEKELLEKLKEKSYKMSILKVDFDLDMAIFWKKFTEIHGGGRYKAVIEKGEIWEFEPHENPQGQK